MIVVRLLNLLGTHVVGSSHARVRILTLRSQNSAEAEVAQLHVVGLVKKYISWFQVPMQHHLRLFGPTCVAFLKGQKNLHENFPYHIFRDEVLLHAALLDELSHVAVLAVLHHDVKFAGLFHDQLVVVLNDVRVT
jgi:hypothetical protein